jgi:phage terminase Nu1 subunit (DNA packaging protein)
MSETVSQTELARILGLGTRQIRNLEAAGMPHESQGNAKAYPIPQAVQWYVGFKSEEAAKKAAPQDLEEARLRKLAAEASLAEYELAEAEGSMIGVEEIDKILGPPLTALRAKLLNLPGKLAPQLLACRSLAEIRTLLDSSIAEAMAELQGVGEITEEAE